jgi:hypothetical protein
VHARVSFDFSPYRYPVRKIVPVGFYPFKVTKSLFKIGLAA